MTPTTALALSCAIITLALFTVVENVAAQSPNTFDSCSPKASSACVSSFRTNFARRPNDTSQDDALSATLTCTDYSSNTTDACLKPVSTSNCSALAKALSSNDTSRYGLLCTTGGQLMMFTLNCAAPSADTSTLYQAVLNTTVAFCTTTINNTLTCSAASSGLETIDKTSLLTGAEKGAGCNATTTKAGTTQIPMLTNPVGPDAITAIVVLGCVLITCILAGFFFWPKCHIAQAPPLPKKVMKKNGAAVGFCPVAAGQTAYDGPVSVNAV